MSNLYEKNIYEDLKSFTFPALLRDALNAVQADVDKREGSVIYDALAPLCVTLAKSFDVLHQVSLQSRFQTAQGEYLDLCGSQFGVYRAPATKAKWKAEFLPSSVEVPLGHKFVTAEGLGFEYEVSANLGGGYYTIICTQAGAAAGADFGVLHPMPPIAGLKSATLHECFDQGANVQSDDEYRLKIWQSLGRRGYGGNFDDYCYWVFEAFREEQNDVATVVSGFQIYPAWQGGGTVKLFIVQDFGDEKYMPASSATIAALQYFLDPVSPAGTGVVPLGHRVTVAQFGRYGMGFKVPLILRSGHSLDAELKAKLIAAVKSYLEGLRDEALTNLGDSYPSAGYVSKFYISNLVSAITLCDAEKIAAVADSGILKRNSIGQYSQLQGDVNIVSSANSAVLPYLDELIIEINGVNTGIYPEV
ncbi:MAG: baseplate J/gp47 family protein [Bacteroidales bacterium]|jgi:uncharacterized phage protein gp47/JayE|nr:baseplate J/gp47 family protein [Bacteroidales bacterium]